MEGLYILLCTICWTITLKSNWRPRSSFKDAVVVCSASTRWQGCSELHACVGTYIHPRQSDTCWYIQRSIWHILHVLPFRLQPECHECPAYLLRCVTSGWLHGGTSTPRVPSLSGHSLNSLLQWKLILFSYSICLTLVEHMVCVPMVAQTFVHSPSQTLGHTLCQSIRNVHSPNIILCHMGWTFNLEVTFILVFAWLFV